MTKNYKFYNTINVTALERLSYQKSIALIKTGRLNKKTTQILDNVAINDVLPLKAARRDAIANLKCFGASDTKDLTSMVTFTFSMQRHLVRLASAPCISPRLATFGWVRFLRATRGKHNAEFTKGG